MLRSLLSLSLALCAMSASRRPASEAGRRPASEARRPTSASGDWKTLFDGKTTRGWHTYGQPSAGSAWKAQDGVLILDASSKSGRGDLVTDNEYENFDLKLQWKVSKGANSGIMFLVHEDTAKYKDTYDTGPEMQILDNEGHPDGKYLKHRAGDLYDLIPCKVQTVKAVGEWNQVEIRLKNDKLKMSLNGVEVVETTLWDDDWKAMVAKSKFAQYPGFAIFHKGHISLQDHGGDEGVSFKDIQIKEL